jgi:succinate dehydrogenase hydrophobic anchor subunit
MTKFHEWMAQANVVILFVVFALIFISLFLERKKKRIWHGNSMIVIMLITTLLVIVHMIPSFVEVVTEALSSFDVVSTMEIVHGLIGIVTLIPGIWLVWMWQSVNQAKQNFVHQKRN